MYLGPPCHGYALNCHLVYLAIPGTHPSCMKNHNWFVLFICNRKSEIQICSNKHETGLVFSISMENSVDPDKIASEKSQLIRI